MDKPSIWDNPSKEAGFLKKFAKYYFVLLVIFAAFILGLIGGRQTYRVVSDSVDNERGGQVYNKKARPAFLNNDMDFNLFWDAWDIIEKNYVKQPVNETQLFYGALAGSVAALGDQHSVFFDPDTTKEFTEELKGSFEGIGAEIARKNEQITIVAPLPDSPAGNAGLKAGDKIMAIDGQSTLGMSLDYAVNQIRGPKGSEVVLTVSRDNAAEDEDYKIIRDKIHIQSVKWKMLDNDIVHIELQYFNEDTEDAFNKAILEIMAKNPKGIIFDLRNNPGGYLDVAISVASEWIENSVIVYEKSSDGSFKEHKSVDQARLKDFPTIVLINGGSASGSEIVAGALKDYDLATLIGEKTFGKGSVQSVFSLDDGSSIKITIAQWLTPRENMIDGQGIEPDIEVELTPEDFNDDKDPQLDKAIEILKEKIK